jgi:AAA+ superfamily predicted ATPase
MSTDLPPWAQEMRDLFKSGSVSQFIIHGNVFDVVPAKIAGQAARMLPLKDFLTDVMFESYDVVLQYDRGKGVRAVKGAEDWGNWLQQMLGPENVSLGQVREAGRALELIDRYLLRTLNLMGIAPDKAPRKIAVVIDFAEFVVPRGDPIQMGGDFSANIVKVLGWANDPAILQCNIVSVLMTEGLHDLNELAVNNPHAAKLRIPLPDEAEMLDYVRTLAAGPVPDLAAKCDVPMETLARRMTGLSRVGARTAITLAINNGRRLTAPWLMKTKKEMIERECQDLMEFLESPFTLDNVAGHDAVKAWLREDTQLLRQGTVAALPMGYLVTGRIGTGKTFLVQCWAGELGVPCVVFKNFRDKWVGATESNLEKIFAVLRALGQVVVFVDEADQVAGRRGEDSGDSGLSGRVYAMLAKEMSDTRNRGKILWVFATSRPDLLEVDLKRQGRLDVHVPLFPPQTPAEMKVLLAVMAKKLNFPLAPADVPDVPAGFTLGGNEVEGALVRAVRTHALSPEPKPPLKEIFAAVIKEVRPSAHSRKMEYMDLIAVKECTDSRFLPPAYRDLTPEEVERRIDALRAFV